MQWLNRSLFRRLFISFFTVFLLGFAIIGLVISMSTKDYITSQKKQEMLRQARNVNAVILEHENVTEDTIQIIE